MSKIDLTKVDAPYYKAAKTPKVVDLPSLSYLTISGIGSPEGDTFQNSIGAIYAAAYTLKFQYKEMEQDFVVPKMEAWWWVNSGLPFNETPRDQWHWKIAIRLPDFVSYENAMTAIWAQTQTGENAQSANIACEYLCEGKSIQMMHIGPYGELESTIESLMNFASENGLQIVGQHHEIYISDPRRAKPENLKTVIRYSVQ